ncbi:MAG: sigma-54 dependent transcriptional regulator [Thermodesulfobacteriota bacterium]
MIPTPGDDSPSPPARLRVAVVDDELVTVRRLLHILGRARFQAAGYTSGLEFMASLGRQPPDVAIMDVHLADADGVDLMQRLHLAAPHTEVILITGYASIPQAVDATKKGAFGYLAKPFRVEELLATVAAAGRQVEKSRGQDPFADLDRADSFGGLIGSSPAMRAVFKIIARVAAVDCSVLVLGESGTGKELVARSLHQGSLRQGRPFVPFNCGAFAEDLIANELFGHEKGAFTGATTTKLGLLETAHGGTVFLDEVGEMPLAMQVKLLRVIQERSFLRVGGVRPIDLDVRFIAATNQDLDRMLASGAFRQDLYYRLKVVAIELPPLRDRREDIPALAAHFVAKTSQRYGKPVPAVAPEFLEPLLGYPFPGNVRELEHIVERAVALAATPTLSRADLPPDLFFVESHAVGPSQETPRLQDIAKEHILEVYRRTGFNQSETARLLGISRTTLWRRLRDFRFVPDKS